MARINAKGKRKGNGPFFALPLEVLRRSRYAELSPKAVKLLIDIGQQYNGANNGFLDCCFERMKRLGWRSTDTLNKAKRELLEAGLIEKTRQGGLFIGPSLYALTWLPINEQRDKETGKLRYGIKPTKKASGLWQKRGNASDSETP